MTLAELSWLAWREAEAKIDIAMLADKRPVNVGAVVLSVADAQALDSLLTKFRVGYLLAHGFDEHNQLRIAIEQASERIKIQSAEIERLKGLHNPELVPAAAHMICTQRDEIERLKEQLREAADDLESWAEYASEYMREKHDLAGTVKLYREAGEVTNDKA